MAGLCRQELEDWHLQAALNEQRAAADAVHQQQRHNGAHHHRAAYLHNMAPGSNVRITLFPHPCFAGSIKLCRYRRQGAVVRNKRSSVSLQLSSSCICL